MFSPVVPNSATCREAAVPTVREPPTGVATRSIDSVDPAALLTDSFFPVNPFAPPALGPDEFVARGLAERAFERITAYFSSLIEDARGISTSKFIAALILCQGATAIVVTKLYSHVFIDSRSIDDHPQTLLLGCILCAALLHVGFQSGVVLVHRAWKGWLKR
jgi:hypothetical protein